MKSTRAPRLLRLLAAVCVPVIVMLQPVAADAQAQGLATGYRYWTISVSNIAEVVAACEAGGYTMVWPVTELRPGIVIAMVEDPDGNWVEFLATSV